MEYGPEGIGRATALTVRGCGGIWDGAVPGHRHGPMRCDAMRRAVGRKEEGETDRRQGRALGGMVEEGRRETDANESEGRGPRTRRGDDENEDEGENKNEGASMQRAENKARTGYED